ncbi:tetraether lipid synthase Tes [uncultured Methanobrevibacter sp.]|uniref:tetraether lipid synthase Tes n=1 Tax=uncultured Methanobrevibacter sp. TaxID=253161 RepID=UPI002614371B
MFIKNTTSLCPTCLKPLEAEVYEEDGRVWIKKECPEHGEFNNTYWSDAELYGRVDQYDSITQDLENPMVEKVAKCPQNCGICSEHESFTVLGLIDVTNRCNLKCPICFANAAVSKQLFEPTQDEIRQMLRNLRNEKPVPAPAIQYAGGEPTVRKDLPDLIRMAKEEGFSHTQIATNGIRIAKKDGYAQELKDAGLNTVYLQFDGVTEEPYLVARNKNLLDVKLEAIEKCRKAGLGIVLVPTVVKGVNDQQVGDIVRLAIENIDIVHGVNFQPVSFSGRTPSDQVEEQRITIPDFLHLIEEQTDGQISKDDFYSATSVQPVSEFIGALQGQVAPATLNCHQHCGSATYIFMEEDNIIPVTRFIDVDGFLAFLQRYTEKIENGSFAIKPRILASAVKNIPKLINEEESPKGLNMKKILIDIFKNQSYESLGEFHTNSLLISCMHFMDPFNFDTDRVKDCVIHYAVPDGRVIPFCTMNSIYRQAIEDEFSVPLNQKMTEFNDKTGEEDEDE